MLPVLHLPVLGSALSTYAVVRTVYVFLALLLTLRLNERQGIRANTTLTAFALGVLSGILGAHLLDMLEYWGEHGGLGEVFSPTGSSIYGALLSSAGRPGRLLARTSRQIIEPAAHLVNPPHHPAVGGEQQDGAVVGDDLHLAWPCSM